MQLSNTRLADKRYYESFDNEWERNIRLNQLRAMQRHPEAWQYESANWWVYYVIYK